MPRRVTCARLRTLITIAVKLTSAHRVLQQFGILGVSACQRGARRLGCANANLRRVVELPEVGALGASSSRLFGLWLFDFI